MSMGRISFVPLAGLALVLPLLAGCAADEPTAPAPTASAAPPSATPPPPPDVPMADADLESLEIAETIAPVRIVVPQLSIDMEVEAEGLDAEGAMGLPENAATAGWYKFGPGVGAAAGATVIAAHIDSRHDGIGPFSRLTEVSPGSIVQVTGSTGVTTDYSVTEVRKVGKIDAPLAEVFDRSGAPRLTLVTCGGEFDSGTGHYVDNVIVTATPVAG